MKKHHKHQKINLKKINLKDYKGDKNKYISLTEASRYTPYSQEYLSLRARQGKLKAIKLGRDWQTTMNAVSDYMREIDFEDGRQKKTISPASGRIILKCGALAAIIVCLSFYLGALNPTILSMRGKRGLANLFQIFKSDYRRKAEVLAKNFSKAIGAAEERAWEFKVDFKEGGLVVKDKSGEVGNLIAGSLNNFSKNSVQETVKIVFRQKKNVLRFFAREKTRAGDLISRSQKKAETLLIKGGEKIFFLVSDTGFRVSRFLADAMDIYFGASEKTVQKISHLTLNFKKGAVKNLIRMNVALSCSANKSAGAVAAAKIFFVKQAGKFILDSIDALDAAAAATTRGMDIAVKKANGSIFFLRGQLRFAKFRLAAELSSGYLGGAEFIKKEIENLKSKIKIAVIKTDGVLVSAGGIAKAATSSFTGKGAEIFASLTKQTCYSAGKGVNAVIIAGKRGKIFLALSAAETKEKILFLTRKTSRSINDGLLAVKSKINKGWEFFSDKLSDGYLAMLNYLIPERGLVSNEPLLAEKTIKKSGTGAVIVPLAGSGGISQNKYLLSNIEETFSDKVIVEPAKDGKAGVIKPVSPAVPNEEYLYMIVPIKN